MIVDHRGLDEHDRSLLRQQYERTRSSSSDPRSREYWSARLAWLEGDEASTRQIAEGLTAGSDLMSRQALLLLAEVERASGRFGPAEDACRRVEDSATSEKEFLLARMDRVRVLLDSGDLDVARALSDAALDRAFQTESSVVRLVTALHAEVYARSGRVKDAITAIERLVSADPARRALLGTHIESIRRKYGV